LQFLRWSAGDDAALALAPTGTFFLLAWLFEEITLFVPRAIEQSPNGCASLVADVMRLHAREEAPHVALDARMIQHLAATRSRWAQRAHTALTLPLLAYVDATVRRAWNCLVSLARDELGLTPAQQRALARRGPSQSDRWGTHSFVDKLAHSGIAGARPLGWLLRATMGAQPA
jgi:uncharacterized protein YceK